MEADALWKPNGRLPQGLGKRSAFPTAPTGRGCWSIIRARPGGQFYCRNGVSSSCRPTATKTVVGIARAEGQEPELRKWFSKGEDIRSDPQIELEVVEFIKAQGVTSVIMTGGIIGCPHEEVIDYPEGTSCPECPYWAGRDRFTKERIQ